MFPNSSFLHSEHLKALPSVGCQAGLTYHYETQRGLWCAAAVVGWGNLHCSQSDAVAPESNREASWGHRNGIAQGICFASGSLLARTLMSKYPGCILSVSKNH